MRQQSSWAWALGLWLAAGCGDSGEGESPGTAEAPRFALVDAAREAGLDHVVTSGRTPSSQILEVKSGGVALIDFDDDGDLDVFVPGGATLDAPEEGPGARLFRNDGELRFTDATELAGITHRRWSMGCAVGDVDADGHDDLFVCCFGANVLLRNTGDGRFEDATVAAGITGEAWSTAASFGDLDGDGDLDLYVVNYLQFDPAAPPPGREWRGAQVFGGPTGLPASADQVFENSGGGQFVDATERWGFGGVPASYGLGAVIVDLGGDAAPEVLVGNDSQANFLFARGADGRFEDAGQRAGLALDEHGWGQATMGIALGDVDGNGHPDVFTSNFMADHHALHMNRGDLRFREQARLRGIAAITKPFLGWGAAFVDLDQDSLEELVVFHGHVYPETITAPMGWRHRQEPLLFTRAGERLERVEPADGGAWLSDVHCDRGAAFGDLDDDGDIDIVVTELNGPLRLLRNDSAAGGWLRVQLRDAREGARNPRGLGTRVTLTGGAAEQARWIVSGTSYQSASAQEAHFGLGAAAGPFAVTVRWPDGHEQRVEAVTPGQVLEVVRE